MINDYLNLNKQEARMAINSIKQQIRNGFYVNGYKLLLQMLEIYPQDDEQEILREIMAIILRHFQNDLDIDCLEAIIELANFEEKDIQKKIFEKIINTACQALPNLMIWVNSYKTIAKAREKLEAVIVKYERVNEFLHSEKIDMVIANIRNEHANYQGKGKNPFYKDIVVELNNTHNYVIDENYKRKTINELLGMCRMLSVGTLTKNQIELLQMWLIKNDKLKDIFPFSRIKPIIEQVLEDGILDEQEKQELLKLFDATAGTKIDGAIGSHNKTIAILPFDEPDIQFAGSIFCLTGEFQTGDRKQIEQIISNKGGVVKKGFTMSINYLVVGLLASDAYKYGNFGSKIEKAIELREKRDIKIM